MRSSLVALALVVPASLAHAQLAVITTLDSGGNVGSSTSIAVGADQRGLISYYDVTNGDLKVAHCDDAACTSATKTTLDSAGNVGFGTSIAIGQDGLGIISYVDVTNAAVKVAHCSNAACTAATVQPIDTGATTFERTAIAIGNDGRPLVVFRAGTVVRVDRCADAACSSATGTSYPIPAASQPAITATAGFPVFAVDNGTVMSVGVCQDAGCTSANVLTLQGSAGAGVTEGVTPIYRHTGAALTRAPDGRAVLTHSYAEGSIAILSYSGLFQRCVDDACTGLTSPVRLRSSQATMGLSDVVVGADNLPRIAGGGSSGMPVVPRLLAFSCPTPTCVGTGAEVIDGPGVGPYASIALGAGGYPLVSYYDTTNQDLKVAYLNGTPTADVAASLQDGPDPIAPTQTLTYNVVITNLGPDTAHGVVARVDLPPGVLFQEAQASVPGSSGCTISGLVVVCDVPYVPTGGSVSVATVEVSPPPGLTGPLTGTLTLTSTSLDPDPTSNTSTTTTATRPGVRGAAPQVIEGNSGTHAADIGVELIGDGSALASSVTVDYQTAPLTAQSGVDYLPRSGTLTFTPSVLSQSVPVDIVGDTTLEQNELFTLLLTNAQGAIAIQNTDGIAILDDDGVSSGVGELTHGTSRLADLRSGPGPVPPADIYRIVQLPHRSTEIVVDAVSGDLRPIALERLGNNGIAVQAGMAVGTGGSVSLRWAPFIDTAIVNNAIRVQSGGCSTDCGPDDVYRIRAYDTTLTSPRFNNSASQFTVLFVQNPSAEAFSMDVTLWDPSGARIDARSFNVGAHGTLVVNTSAYAPGRNGSITVAHDAPYGVLQGKAVAIEPSTGYSFDSPLTHRPK